MLILSDIIMIVWKHFLQNVIPVWKYLRCAGFEFNFNENRIFVLFSCDTNCTIFYIHITREVHISSEMIITEKRKKGSRTNKHLSSAPIWYYTLNANWLQNVGCFFHSFFLFDFAMDAGFCLAKMCFTISPIEMRTTPWLCFSLWCWHKMPTTRKRERERNVYKQTITYR